MISENFIYLAAFITVAGSFSYFRDTLMGKAKPNRVSFIIWGIAPLIAFFSQLEKGVGIQALFTLLVGLAPLAIFAASFFDRKAYWKLTAFDLICGLIAVFGIILWQTTNNAAYGLLFSILADFFASIPTIRKSYSHPNTENSHAYTSSAIAAVITLLTINTWDVYSVAFPVYIFSACSLISFLIESKIGLRQPRLKN